MILLKKYNFRKIQFVWVLQLIVALGMHTGLQAQQDTIFWFAAPDISSAEGQSPIYLKFQSYSDPAIVTVSLPANGGFSPIVVNLTANDNDSINLTPFIAQIESPAANVVATTGIKVSSSANITAYYEVVAPSNREMFSLKGSKGLGTNFYTPFQKFWDNAVVAPATFSSFEIVATQDNTTVLITPRTNITGHTANVTYSIILDQGETYSGRDMNVTAATSLAGSIISSDKPIAVTLFSGALSNAGCTSTIGDQITPTDYIGKDYIIRKGTATNERVFILATANGTSIDIENSGTTSTLINWGETYSYTLTDNENYIHTSKPVYVWHVSGFGCSIASAQVPSLFCAGKYEQTFVRSNSDSLGLILYTRSGFEDAFQLNGNPSLITASDFNVVPGTSGDFVVALKYFNTTDVPINTYNLVTNSEDIFGMAVLHGKSGTDASYAYLSEFHSYPFVDAGLAEDTICANIPYTLTGIVGGGSVTGSWGSSGYGTFVNGLTALDNTYICSNLDTIISPISIILSSTGPCPVQKDTLILHVEPAPIVNASADQTVCANNANVTLDGAVYGGSTTGIWSTLGSGSFLPGPTTLDATYVPSPADTTAGTVTLVLTSTGAASCNIVSDTMVVTITDSPVATISGADTIYVCSNNPGFSLSGTVFGATSTGKWTTSGNGSFSPDNLSLNSTYSPTPTDVAGGILTIYLQSTGNGACLVSKDSIKVVFTPSPVVYAGGDILACTNEPAVILSGSVSGATTSGQWSGGAGTFTPNSATLNAGYVPTAAEVSGGTMVMTLTSTANGGCLAVSDNVQITFITPPFANFNYTNVCNEDTTAFTDFSLNGFGSLASWHWDFGDGSTSTTQNNLHLFPNSGAYDVELIVMSDAGCYDTTVQTVDVYELPVADFSYVPSCDNNIVIIDFTDESTTTNDPINYWYYDFGGQGNQAVENPSQLFIGNGNFVITHIVKTSHGCTDTLVEIINIPPKPIAGFYYNTSNGLNVGAEFYFTDTSSNAVNWYWDFGNGQNSIDQDPNTIYFANGTYSVTQWAYGPVGCVDSITTDIVINTVTNEIEKLIPNAISPNGDGKNDVWKLNFINLVNPQAEIIVMNRWGQTLYSSIGYSEPFDGTYHGEALPEGTYFYIIKISDEEIYQGALLILTATNE